MFMFLRNATVQWWSTGVMKGPIFCETREVAKKVLPLFRPSRRGIVIAEIGAVENAVETMESQIEAQRKIGANCYFIVKNVGEKNVTTEIVPL